MRPIKWETIKRNATTSFLNQVQYGAGFPSPSQFLALVDQSQTGVPAKKTLEGWTEYGKKLIDNWDVRCVGTLIECFPGCVPSTWKGRELTAYMADSKNGDWMVVPCERGQ